MTGMPRARQKTTDIQLVMPKIVLLTRAVPGAMAPLAA